MTSIKLTVTGASARAEVDGLLTSGMVGIPVTISYDGAVTVETGLSFYFGEVYLIY